MLSDRENRMKAMLWDYPERIPVGVGILPAAWMKYRDELEDVVLRHPTIFGDRKRGDTNYDNVWSGTYITGEHTDVWGCVWSNIKDGMEAIVTGHPVPTRAAVHELKVPEEDAGFPHGFMYLRLEDLRSFEEIMIDYAEEPPELQMLIDKVLTYNLRQGRNRLAGLEGKEPQICYFGDDLGTQNALPMRPETWRKYLKPCFEQIYRPFRDAGHYIYMHTDGHINEIIPDLIDCGVNVVNPQVRANGLQNLREVCHGKVCVDLDLDRQLFPFCTPQQIHDHIGEAVEVLGDPSGGLWLKAEVGDDVPLENVDAICTALENVNSVGVA